MAMLNLKARIGFKGEFGWNTENSVTGLILILNECYHSVRFRAVAGCEWGRGVAEHVAKIQSKK